MKPRGASHCVHQTVAIIESEDMGFYSDDILGESEYLPRDRASEINPYGLHGRDEFNANLELHPIHDMRFRSVDLSSSMYMTSGLTSSTLGNLGSLPRSLGSKLIPRAFPDDGNIDSRSVELGEFPLYDLSIVSDFNEASDNDDLKVRELQSDSGFPVLHFEDERKSNRNHLQKSTGNVDGYVQPWKSTNDKMINGIDHVSNEPLEKSVLVSYSTENESIKHISDNNDKSVSGYNRWRENEMILSLKSQEDVELSNGSVSSDIQLPILGKESCLTSEKVVDRPVVQSQEHSNILNCSISSDLNLKASSLGSMGPTELCNGVVVHENGRIKLMDCPAELTLE